MKRAIVLYVTGFVAVLAGISYQLTRPAAERAETFFDVPTLVLVCLGVAAITTATMITHPPVSRYELRAQLAASEMKVSELEKVVSDSYQNKRQATEAGGNTHLRHGTQPDPALGFGDDE